MKKVFLLAAVLGSAMFLTACGGGGGGGGGGAVQGVTSDPVIAINASTGVQTTSAVLDQPFTFNEVIPEFGTMVNTVAFTTRSSTGTPDPAVPAGNPGFTITGPNGQAATGVMEFGSCRFRVTQSNFTQGGLVNGAIITVQRCELILDIAGTPADSVTRQQAALLRLNNALSDGRTVNVNIGAGGEIRVNGFPLITVILNPLTGLTSQ